MSGRKRPSAWDRIEGDNPSNPWTSAGWFHRRRRGDSSDDSSEDEGGRTPMLASTASSDEEEDSASETPVLDSVVDSESGDPEGEWVSNQTGDPTEVLPRRRR